MGHDDDRVEFAQAQDEFFHPGGGDRVERRAGLVHQDDLRIHRHGPGDAQPLLLPPGKAGRHLVQPVFDLVPQSGAAQRALDHLVERGLPLLAEGPRPVGDVVVDAAGERVVFLEDHPDMPPQLDRIDRPVRDVRAFNDDRALGHAGTGDQVVHPVEAAQQGRFAAAGGANESSDLVRRNVERNVFQHHFVTVAEIHPVHLDGRHAGRGSGRRCGR